MIRSGGPSWRVWSWARPLWTREAATLAGAMSQLSSHWMASSIRDIWSNHMRGTELEPNQKACHRSYSGFHCMRISRALSSWEG